VTNLISLKVLFVAGFGPIARDPAISKSFYVDTMKPKAAAERPRQKRRDTTCKSVRPSDWKRPAQDANWAAPGTRPSPKRLAFSMLKKRSIRDHLLRRQSRFN
jgi:hypothetical protein